MAATKKGNTSSRLDFGQAFNEAVDLGNLSKKTKEEQEVKEEVKQEVEQQVEQEVKQETKQEESSNQEVKEQEKEKAKEQKEERQEKEEEKSSEEEKEKEEVKSTIENEALKFKALASKKQGATKSVYFERDVLDFLISKSEQYNVKFSKVVNLLIKEAMEE